MTRAFSGLKAATLALSLSLACVTSASAETMGEMFPAYVDWLEPELHEAFGKLEIRRGSQPLADGKFELRLGEDYYALTGADARWVLESLWQNLPSPDLQAIVFHTGTQPLDSSWAVTVYQDESGHIEDEEAQSMDYQAIIDSRQAAEPELNRQRREAGLPELTTVGLTGTPGYDRTTRTLTFSVLLRQQDYAGEILNANAWVLSRHGFVNLNVLGTAEQAPEVSAVMPELVSLVALAEGNRYEDYLIGVDAVAEGGLSALLGGGAAQAGLIVVALALLKKFGFLLILPAIWLGRMMFGRKPTGGS